MKGICFIEPLFHKVVKGEKTQTRRMITPQPVDSVENLMFFGNKVFRTRDEYDELIFINPKYEVGEKVYLKEPYQYADDVDGGRCYYKFCVADILQLKANGVDITRDWQNKLFMSEYEARYYIEITAVRAERLQDISEEDCLKEGIELYNNYDGTYGGHSAPTAPKEAYAALINSINGKGTWEKNPFVWVYDFRLIQR